MTLNKIVANNIKYIRTINSISQEELANAIGINQSYISAIERSEKPISLNRLEEIANILKVESYILLKKDLKDEIQNSFNKKIK